MRAWFGAVLMLAACGGGQEREVDAPPVLRIAGSDSLTRQLLPPLIATHKRTRRSVRFEVTSGGSSAGFRSLLAGEADIAASSRDPTPAEEEQAKVNGYSLKRESARNIVAVDVVALAVHPSNPISSLTYDQVIGIFCTRSVDNWSFLGLEDQTIQVYARGPESGTRALFEDFFCGPRGISPRVSVKSAAQIASLLQNEPAAIAFVSMSGQAGKILALRPEANGAPIAPSQQNIIRGAYPLYHDLYLYTAGPPGRVPAEFINWIASPAGQEVVDEAGFVPLFLRPERLDAPRPLRETIHFEAASAIPNQRSMARLQLLEEELRERAGESRHIILEGYTDVTEPQPQVLSKLRAEAVRDLLSANLPGLYFEIIPRGAATPIAPNTTPYGRERNRRVQIYLASEEHLPEGE